MAEPTVRTDADRVREHTSEGVLDRIDAQTRARVEQYERFPEQIDMRLEELEHEWDVERWLEANASALTLVGVALTRWSRRWIVMPAVIQGFLLQHAVQGWCPPLAVFRRLGVRTRREIDAEKYALKALRGDFASVGRAQSAEAALTAASR